MLENIWIIPAIPVLSFFLILFFGKRLPKGGSEIGVTALAAVFVLSVVAGVQWIGTEKTLKVEHHGAEEGGHAEEEGDHAPAEEEHSEEEEEHALVGATGEQALGPIAAVEEGDHGEGDGATEVGEPVEGDEDLKRAPVERYVTWWESGDVKVQAGTYVDGLSIALLFVVATVSFLVHIYSTNYMHDDERYTHFFAALSLFTAGMLVLVTAGSTLQMMFGWELMGLCSFMLIGHWWEEHKNSSAALKAFFTTRTGDVGLLVGVSILFFGAGETFQIADLNEAASAGNIQNGVLVAGAIALLIAVIGKSAQFPLHTWLPDAMAGPTPVSALIHAATMVVAGVFLIARLYPVFYEAFDIGAGDGYTPIAMTGAITILIAAALAFVQSDIKKVLAYSTVSQLGFMVMSLGVGGWTAGVFHLFTHAFFKACLFLGSGSVSHAVHSFDMKKDMGGLRKYMPITYWTFLIASLALAGVPPLAGFWSKDEILLSAGEGGYTTFMWVGLVGAVMTAAYMTRCIYLTFFGEYRGHGHPHESPLPITVPLMVLAGLSIVAGFTNAVALGIDAFADIVEPQVVSNIVSHHDFSVSIAVLGTLAGLLGIGLGYAYYFMGLGPRGLVERGGPARAGYRLLENRYYLDHLYEDGVVASIKGPIARAAYWTNQNVLDGVVNAAGIAARHVANFTYRFIDQGLIDGAVNGAGQVSDESGGILRHIQTGRVQQYAAMLFAAVGAFALWLVLSN